MLSINDKLKYISDNAWTPTGLDISAYAYDRLKENGHEKAISPYNLGLKITDRCDFRCINCFVRKGKNDMDISLVDNILEALPAKPFSIYLTGGDPFLHGSIFEIIDKLYKENIVIKIHSTGILSDNNIEALERNIEKIDTIQISIDSITNYSEMRPNSIDDPINEIKKFITRFNDKVNLHVNFVLSVDNKDCIFDVIDFCSENKIKSISIAPVITSDKSKVILDKDNIDFVYEITKYSLDKNVKLSQEPFNHPWSLKSYHNFKDEFGDSEHFCPAQKTEMEVDMHGDVYPCPFLYNEQHKMGNIKKDSFEKIWSSGCKELNHMNWSKSRKCLSCSEYKLCGGGCYAAASINGAEHDERCCL